MAKYAILKAAIEEIITTNGNYEISGEDVRNTLKAIVDSLGADYQLVGVATPATNPGTPDQNVAYIAPAGSYPNFGSLTIGSGKLGILKYNGSWSKEEIQLNDALGISANGLYYNTQAGDVVAKTVYAPDYSLFAGGSIKIHFNNANEASNPTLNVNSTGAKSIMYNGALASPTNTWKSGDTVLFYYDSYGSGQWVGTPLLDLPDFINVNELINDSTEFGSAALARAAVPLNYRKYGLQITYLLADGWYTDQFIGDDTSDWGVVDNWKVLGPVSVSQNTLTIGGEEKGELAGQLIENPEWVAVFTDNSNRIIFGFHKPSGKVYFGEGCPQQIKDYVADNALSSDSSVISVKIKDNDEFNFVVTDNSNKIIWGLRKDGSIVRNTLIKQDIYNKNVVDSSELIPTMKESVTSFATLNLFPKNKLPCICFRFADNPEADKQVVELFDKYSVKCGFSFIASAGNIGTVGNRYLAWNKRGFSIENHSIDGREFNYTNYPTIQDARNAISTAMFRLRNIGICVSSFVTPSGTIDSDFLPILKDYCAYAFTGHSVLPTRESDCCNIDSFGIQNKSLQEIKDLIDNAIANDNYLNLYGHAADFGTTYSGTYEGQSWSVVYDINFVEEILQYVISKRNNGDVFLGSPDECAKYYFDL